jgi:hypothetical protein
MHWGKEKLVDEKERKGISYSEGPYMHTVLRSHRYAAAEAGPTRMLTGRSKTPKKKKTERRTTSLLESKKGKAPMGISLDRITSVEGGTDGTDSRPRALMEPPAHMIVPWASRTNPEEVRGVYVRGWACCATPTIISFGLELDLGLSA